MSTWTNILSALSQGKSLTVEVALAGLWHNLEAVRQGDASAPKIANAALDPVQAGALSLGVGSLSGSLDGAVPESLAVVMNAYSFWPIIKQTNASGGLTINPVRYTDATAPGFRLVSSGGGTVDYYINWSYINP